MKNPIVDATETVTLVGGADVSSTVLNICLNHAPKTIAADGGANHLFALGIEPVAVIGDFDSLSGPAQRRFDALLHHRPDQNTTDFEKVVANVHAPLCLAAGFLGGRLDHGFAVLGALVRQPERKIILVSETDVVFCCSGTLALDLPPQTRIALLPMAPTTVTTIGLRWNLDGQELSPTGLISSSNQVAESQVRVTVSAPLILTLPLAALDAAMAAVQGR